MMRFFMTLLALVVSGVCVASQGYIEKEGTRMTIRDSVAVLDEQVGKLTVYLLPTRLSATEKAKIKQGNVLMVLLRKGSPDSDKWNWYPYARLELKDATTKFTSPDTFYGYYLMAYGLKQKNYTDNLNGYFQGDEVLRNYHLGSDRLEFEFSGGEKSMAIKWRLDVDAPLL